MKTAVTIVLAAIFGSAIYSPALAAGRKVIMLTPDEIKWQPFGLWQRAVLAGNLTKPGCPLTVRYKVPAGTRVPEHALEQDQTSTVLSGTMMIGIGGKWEDAKLKPMRPGSFYIIPADISHFKINNEEVIYQSSVIGPGGYGCPKTSAVVSVMLNPDQMLWRQWGESAQRVVLAGAEDKVDCPPYTDRIKFAAHTRIPPHMHDEDRIYTVLSGILLVGIGDKWNDKKLKKMPPDSFIAIPAGISRYFKTDEEVEFQNSVISFPPGGAKSCK